MKISIFTLIYKVILLGDERVGKTTLRRSYMGRTLSTNYQKTIGVDFAIKKHQDVTFQIWDIAGEASNKTIQTFLRGTEGAILLYDITNNESIISLKKWLKLLFETLSEDFCLAIVGNKIDLRVDSFDVPSNLKEAKEYLSTFDLKCIPGYFETSALTGKGVDTVFDWIFENTLQNNHDNPIDT